jgi:ketosteroid isomerase-like protein
MKNYFLNLVVLILICFSACTTPQDTALTEEDKTEIKQQITTMVDSVASSANELRTDYFKKVYWNDDRFVGIDLTGPKSYDAYMKETDAMYAGMKNIEFNEENLRIIVFDKNSAIALFEGYAKGESKEGVKMNLNNFTASMFFRKVDGEWKIAYTHESAEQEIVMPEADSTEVKM